MPRTKDLVHSLIELTNRKDLTIDALRDALQSARIRVEHWRDEAELKEVSMSRTVKEVRSTLESERRAFAEREEMWCRRCEELETAARIDKSSCEQRLKATAQELRRALDRVEELEQQVQAAQSLRSKDRMDAALITTQNQVIAARDRQLASAASDKVQLEEQLATATSLVKAQKQVITAKEGELKVASVEISRLETEVAKQQYEPHASPTMCAQAVSLVTQLEELKSSYERRALSDREELSARVDELSRRNAELNDINVKGKADFMTLQAQLQKERDDRARWARARIDLLTKFIQQSSQPHYLHDLEAVHPVPPRNPADMGTSPSSYKHPSSPYHFQHHVPSPSSRTFASPYFQGSALPPPPHTPNHTSSSTIPPSTPGPVGRGGVALSPAGAFSPADAAPAPGQKTTTLVGGELFTTPPPPGSAVY